MVETIVAAPNEFMYRVDISEVNEEISVLITFIRLLELQIVADNLTSDQAKALIAEMFRLHPSFPTKSEPCPLCTAH